MQPTQSERTTNQKLLLYIVAAFLLGVTALYALQNAIDKKPTPQNSNTVYNISRVQGFRNVQPLLLVETANKAESFAPLRGELKKLVDSLKAVQQITQASIFIKEFDRGEWTSLNKSERYHPASLMKVALLLGYLRIAETNPGLFEQQWLYEQPNTPITSQYYNSKSIEPGKKYTVHELLYYMIAHSDNHATWLLASRFDNALLKRIFAEFGLPEPIEDDIQFTMTVREYSVFFNAIFNASTISPSYADYAADLLSNCDFQEGFVKGFPAGTKMWHKFGEWRNFGHDYELHESGIVYMSDKPYLITIMTKGKDTDNLALAIQKICRKIYQGIPAP